SALSQQAYRLSCSTIRSALSRHHKPCCALEARQGQRTSHKGAQPPTANANDWPICDTHPSRAEIPASRLMTHSDCTTISLQESGCKPLRRSSVGTPPTDRRQSASLSASLPSAPRRRQLSAMP